MMQIKNNGFKSLHDRGPNPYRTLTEPKFLDNKQQECTI